MYNFLGDCQKIEELAKHIYQRFADNESYANEVRKVFRKLSIDEKVHARNLDLVRQATNREMESLPTLTIEKLNEALELAEKMHRYVERVVLGEEKALKIAIDMENKFIKVHANNVLHSSNQRLADLFDQLGREDQEHLDTLKDCLKWWHSTRKQP